MPHSVSPGIMQEEDVILPDAPEEPTIDAEDGMDTSNEDEAPPRKGADVKLEDLFQTDDEDDDEFTSSPPARNGVAAGEDSSPPLMPMFVPHLN